MGRRTGSGEYLGYVGDVDGVDYTARYVYRETTVEVLADALRLVTYDSRGIATSAVKALAILKTHGWRRTCCLFRSGAAWCPGTR
jgi:hypothetical protein